MNDSHERPSDQSTQNRPLWPWGVGAVVLMLMSLVLSFWVPLQARKPVVEYVQQHGMLDVKYNHPRWLFFIDEQTYHPWFDEVRAIWLGSPSDQWLKEIEKFSEVAELALNLSNASPEAIGRLSCFRNLETVQLSGNDQPKPLAWLGELPKLKEVTLSDMPCVVEDWKSIAASSTSIRSLSFYRFDDRFTADHAEALAAVPSLRSLAFEGTSQHAAGCWAPFAHRDTLEVLILRDAIIKPEEMSSICGISSLRMLWIQSNAEFSTAEIEQLKRLEKLEILSLSGSELTEEAYEILASLPSLKELDLEGVHVLDDHVRVLSESSSLETLRLEKSLFTDEGLMSLDKLSTLKQVHVLSSKVTEAGIQRFQSVRPDVLTDYEIIDEEFAPAE